MFVAITRDDLSDAKWALAHDEQTEMNVFVAKAKSTLKRRLTTAGWNLDDIMILEVPDDFNGNR